MANGKIALPEDSSKLFAFYKTMGCDSSSNISFIEFNRSIDTAKVKNMERIFAQGVESSVYYGVDLGHPEGLIRKDIKNLDLSGWNTSSVENMSNMFLGSSVEELELNVFDTSNVTDMHGMFNGSKATEIKGLNKFNTSKVTNMSQMFSYSKMTILDLSDFDTSNVTNVYWMFYDCLNLKTIYASNKFNTSNVTGAPQMFKNSTNLVGGAGTTYNSSKIDKTYAHIDGGTSNPGYFTLKNK